MNGYKNTGDGENPPIFGTSCQSVKMYDLDFGDDPFYHTRSGVSGGL